MVIKLFKKVMKRKSSIELAVVEDHIQTSFSLNTCHVTRCQVPSIMKAYFDAFKIIVNSLCHKDLFFRGRHHKLGFLEKSAWTPLSKKSDFKHPCFLRLSQ